MMKPSKQQTDYFQLFADAQAQARMVRESVIEVGHAVSEIALPSAYSITTVDSDTAQPGQTTHGVTREVAEAFKALQDRYTQVLQENRDVRQQLQQMTFGYNQLRDELKRIAHIYDLKPATTVNERIAQLRAHTRDAATGNCVVCLLPFPCIIAVCPEDL